MSVVQGFGRRIGTDTNAPEYGDTVMAKLEIVVPRTLVERVVEAIAHGARTQRPGDGQIFVIAVENVINVRTGAEGLDAL